MKAQCDPRPTCTFIISIITPLADSSMPVTPRAGHGVAKSSDPKGTKPLGENTSYIYIYACIYTYICTYNIIIYIYVRYVCV